LSNLIRIRQVREKTGLSDATIYRKIGRAGKNETKYLDPSFPKPVSLGGRSIAWREAEVDEWVATRPGVERPADKQPAA
jgi:prophage regulatory protein